ncbi:unnamed protein product, partial [Rotaria sp. Silwood2]
WSERFCIVPYNCTCSSDTICIDLSAYNRSVCICPIYKFGHRCLLTDKICEINNNLTRQNGGQCMPIDERMRSKKKFICICQKSYSGDRCEMVDNKIILSFRNDITLSSSMFIHFIEVVRKSVPKRTTTLLTIPPAQKSHTIHWPILFHLVFIEIFNKTYYLTHTQKT